MPFDRPSLLTLKNRIESDIKNNIDDPTTLLRRSVFKVFAKVAAGQHYLQYGFFYYMALQIFATTAEKTFLDLIGNEYGIPRKAGTSATGIGAATGTVGTVIPAGTRLQSDSGNIYTVDSGGTIGGTGSISLSITAESYGDDYNEDGGANLSFVSPISGVNSVFVINSDGITGGVDEELDDDYRLRILARRRQPPHGGADFDYVSWALEVSGVTRAWSIPQYQGPGTIGLAFVRDNDTNILPDATQRAAVYNYLISHEDPITGVTTGVPVTAVPGFFVIELTFLTLNFIIALDPNTAAVQAAIRANLSDLIKSNGGPGQLISISQLYGAIDSATGEVKSRIVSPIIDQIAAVNQIHNLGDISWENY